MDRSAQLRDLAETEQHIAGGIKHISNQELLIENLDLREEDSTLARSLLKTFASCKPNTSRTATASLES